SGRLRLLATCSSATATARSAGVAASAGPPARPTRPTSASVAAAHARCGLLTSLPRILVHPVAAVVRRREEGEIRREPLVVDVHAVPDPVVDVVLPAGHAVDDVGHVVVRTAPVRDARAIRRCV